MYLRPFGQGPKPARAAPARNRHASPAQIRRHRSTACSSVAPREAQRTRWLTTAATRPASQCAGLAPCPAPGQRGTAGSSSPAAVIQARFRRPARSPPPPPLVGQRVALGQPRAPCSAQGAPGHASCMHPCRRPALVMSPGPLSQAGSQLPCSSGSATAYAVALPGVGARLPLRSSHAPPRPPSAHSARCPGGRAQPRPG